MENKDSAIGDIEGVCEKSLNKCKTDSTSWTVTSFYTNTSRVVTDILSASESDSSDDNASANANRKHRNTEVGFKQKVVKRTRKHIDYDEGNNSSESDINYSESEATSNSDSDTNEYERKLLTKRKQPKDLISKIKGSKSNFPYNSVSQTGGTNSNSTIIDTINTDSQPGYIEPTTTVDDRGSQTKESVPNPIDNDTTPVDDTDSGSQTKESVSNPIVNDTINSGSQSRKNAPAAIDYGFLTDSDDERPQLQAAKDSRKRTRDEDKWAQNQSKIKRNSGQAYEFKRRGTNEIKKVEQKKMGSPCSCKKKCFTMVGEEGIKAIFKAYWATGNYNVQTSEILKRIKKIPIKRKRTKGPVSIKTYTSEYSVQFKGVTYIICQNAFISIYGISHSRVKVALSKESEAGTTIPDQRGKNPKKWTFSQEVVDCIHHHIRQLPVCSSHYTRTRNPNRQYLEANNSIQQLYMKYRAWMYIKHPTITIVNKRYYNKVFSTNYNIGFRPTRKDACSTCQRFYFERTSALEAGKNVDKLDNEKADHINRTKVAQACMKSAKKEKNNNEWKFICMDLQQIMPCPKLAVGLAYYKRKLSLMNFCIHDLQLKQSYMYVWEENVAARGSVEIFSCLYKYLQVYVLNTPDHPRNLRIFADNCGGQNKNIHMIFALLREVHKKNFDRIELCYLVPGHSYMPCDRSFGNIEKFLRKMENVMSPLEYCGGIVNATEKPFPLYHMEREDFMDIEIMKRNKIATRRPVLAKAFQTAAQIILTSEYPDGYILQDKYHLEDKDGQYVSVVHHTDKNNEFDLSHVDLPQKYPQERKLDPLKIKDLQSLMNYMGDHSGWIQDLVDRQNSLASNTDQNNTTVEDEDDPNQLSDVVEGRDRIFEYDSQVRYHTRSQV